MNDFWLTIAQLTINGIAVGAIYALVALGIVLIYKATEVLNFAHGDLLVVSAFSAWGLITVWGLPFWLALMITVLGVALFAFALDAFGHSPHCRPTAICRCDADHCTGLHDPGCGEHAVWA